MHAIKFHSNSSGQIGSYSTPTWHKVNTWYNPRLGNKTQSAWPFSAAKRTEGRKRTPNCSWRTYRTSTTRLRLATSGSSRMTQQGTPTTADISPSSRVKRASSEIAYILQRGKIGQSKSYRRELVRCEHEQKTIAMVEYMHVRA